MIRGVRMREEMLVTRTLLLLELFLIELQSCARGSICLVIFVETKGYNLLLLWNCEPN